VPQIGPPGLTWRGLETGLRRTYTGTKLETADTAKGSLRGTAPVLIFSMVGVPRHHDHPDHAIVITRITPS
jgi:hypothetical protein